MEISTGWTFSLIGPILQIFNIVLLIAVIILATRLLRRFKALDFVKKLWLQFSLWLRILTIISAALTILWFCFWEFLQNSGHAVFVEIYGSITFLLLTFVIIALLVESSEKWRIKKTSDE